MSFIAGSSAPLRCPTLPEIRDGLVALLPRGRAWQTHESGPAEAVDAAFQEDAFDPEAFQVKGQKGSILWRFWTAIAAVLLFVNGRWCALRLEFWCASMSETRDQWMIEYGLPDPCDPFPDLCAKVSALGGTRCEYYAEVAARAGWSITCDELNEDCGAQLGCALAGDAMTGGRVYPTELLLRVFLDDSPAYVDEVATPPLAGMMLAGLLLSCDPDLTPLKCLMNRVVHAHVTIDYVPIGGL